MRWRDILCIFGRWGSAQRSLLAEINRKLEVIMATQQEAAAELVAVKEQLVKVGGETSTLLAKIEELLGQLANAPVSEELQAAIDGVKEQAAVVDNLVPDA